jgi:ParB family chromosome partitioning protein
MARKGGLGKGLGALFSDMDEFDDIGEERIAKKSAVAENDDKRDNVIKKQPSEEQGDSQPVYAAQVDAGKERTREPLNASLEIDIASVFPNPNQPRKRFDPDAMAELTESVKLHGIIQPLVVVKKNDGYMIIAGERRWRAATEARLLKVPAVVKSYSEQKIREISLIENLQREDLNVIDAAHAIKQLMEEFRFTQEEVADRLGKSRPAIANTLRLLSLCPEVVKMIEDGALSAGHARCLVVVNDRAEQIKFAKAAADNKVTVRELERIVREYNDPPQKEPKIREQSPELRELVLELTRSLGTRVSAIGNDTKGRLYIDYFTRDDLERIFIRLTKI